MQSQQAFVLPIVFIIISILMENLEAFVFICGTETLIDRPSLSGAECAEGVARPWLQVALSVHERLRVAALGVLRKG